MQERRIGIRDLKSESGEYIRDLEAVTTMVIRHMRPMGARRTEVQVSGGVTPRAEGDRHDALEWSSRQREETEVSCSRPIRRQ